MISLRPTTTGDREFLIGLFAACREPRRSGEAWPPPRSVEREFDQQLQHYLSAVPAAEVTVIEADGQPIGRLVVRRRPFELRLLDIALLPAHRGGGIGTDLLRALMDEARATGQPLCCDVERWNHRARGLYQRLGFRALFEDPICTALIWVADDDDAVAR